MSGLAESFDSERPGWHISDTIDFVHVISGEVILRAGPEGSPREGGGPDHHAGRMAQLAKRVRAALHGCLCACRCEP